MVICPECGFPVDEGFVVAPEEAVRCLFCKWVGSRKDLLLIAGGDLQNHPQMLDRLRVLMEFLSNNIVPQIGIKVVQLGLLPGDVRFAPLLASILKKVTLAAFRTLVTELLQEDRSGSEAGREVHREASGEGTAG